MHFYAQIDAANIVTGISQLSGKVDKSNMVKIPDYDLSLMGKKWTGTAFEAAQTQVIEPDPLAVEAKTLVLDKTETEKALKIILKKMGLA